jgi:hypothetical protein
MSAVMGIDQSQLPPCPPPGSGVNRWLLQAANHLRQLRVPEFDAAHILRSLMTRPEKGGEIDRAIRKAYASQPCRGNDRAGARSRIRLNATRRMNPRAQTSDSHAIEKVVSSGFTYSDFQSISPINFRLRVDTRAIIEDLFPEDALICCSREKAWGTETRLIPEFGDELDRFSFIVPQAMTTREGLTQDKPPKKGPRTLNNTGPWRFFVYESDSLSLDKQAAVIYTLASIQPLALAVFSGGKSIHAYFYVGALSEQELLEFQCLAIRLGGCTGPLNRCQLVRMPGGVNRSTKRQQEVPYFDPSVTV